jgi:putative endonuclease
MGRREAAEARGRRAEALAAWWLRAKGYTILSIRVKLPVGEIDIVAMKRDVIVFIEVKERATLEAAMGAVTPGAWRRIARAAESWMAQRPRYNACGWRYDIIALAPGRLPAHVRDAWRPGMA